MIMCNMAVRAEQKAKQPDKALELLAEVQQDHMQLSHRCMRGGQAA